MAHLSVRLLGSLQVTLDGEPVTGFESDKVRALLAYLVAEPHRPHRREALAGLLWPDWPERSARTNLRRALANLRQAIGDHQAKPPFLHISRQTIQFNNASDAWVDVTAFTQLLEAPTPIVRELEEAVDLYRGRFLEEFSLGDSATFEEWALLKREQIGRQVLSALHRLADTYERRGEYGCALPYAWRQVELEPWQEKAQRQLMRLLALNGQRGAALAQYQACRRALAAELGVEPAQETVRLYERIRDGEELDLAQAENQHQLVEMTPVQSVPPGDEAPPTIGKPALASPPSAQRRSSSRRMAGGRLALVGVGLLLLIIVGAIILFAARGGFVGARSPEVFTSPPTPVAAPPEGGKLLDMCEGATHPQICMLDPRTGRFTQVTNSLEFETISGFAWSPDGQQIIFNAGSDSHLTGRHDHKLYVINADGSHLRQVTGGDTNDVMPAWAPDGQWIAFHRNCSLWIVHPDGSEARTLLGEPGFCVGATAWSPDSQQIAFLNKIDQGVFILDEIWVINRDGTAPRAVHSFERPLAGGILTWSPDGWHIVCHYLLDDEERFLLISADGSGEPRRVDGVPGSWFPNFWPQWSEEE